MRARGRHPGRTGLIIFAAFWMLVIVPLSATAAPYAAMVMDARTGKVLHSRNADTRLHPASLTKMMTLYIAFQAVESGEISLDTRIKVSRNAASEPPTRLGLKAGSRIKLRYCIRAAAIKSANDCATAIGEAISGSEAKFARRMTRTAKALGMTRTTFKNAHGLTEKGHLSTARDMTILGRHLLYDFPQYYNLFSRRSSDAGLRKVYSHNRLLSSYKGADGIKTGYTRAAGFNLVASAERGNVRIIATMFGGRSAASRDAKVAKLLDLGFRRAPSNAPLRKPTKPSPGQVVIASNSDSAPALRGKTIRLVTTVKKSLRPQLRPGAEPEAPKTAPVIVAGLKDDIQKALAKVEPTPVEKKVVAVAKQAPSVAPKMRPKELVFASAKAAPDEELVEKPLKTVIRRKPDTGKKAWGVNIGRYNSRYQAERVLLKTALSEMETLEGTERRVRKGKTGYDANFMGLDRDTAELACSRLQARKVPCFMISPG